MKKILCIFFCVILLSGCNKDIRSYEYVGESDNWEVVYKYKVNYLKNGDNDSENDMKINYKGEIEKLANGEVIKVTYKIGAKSGSDTLVVEDVSESFDIGGPGGLNASTLQGSEVGIITVSWGENYEEFEIKSSKE
ncbi:MAG: membrane lipoprotein lipid attachment site-containing protein [Psychrobacillus psychrodurans]